MATPFTDVEEEPAVRGLLYHAKTANGDGFVLTHGAGSNCQSKLLVGIASALTESGFEVLCVDLPFRQARPYGPPFPNSAKRDREGIRRVLRLLRTRVRGRVFAGGHSYGGRQTTILISEEPELTDGVRLLSYPLHPPAKPAQLRTEHFPNLRTPALFVHGTRDPFGSVTEMSQALNLIPSTHALMEVEGAGHDLQMKLGSPIGMAEIVSRFQSLVNGR